MEKQKQTSRLRKTAKAAGLMALGAFLYQKFCKKDSGMEESLQRWLASAKSGIDIKKLDAHATDLNDRVLASAKKFWIWFGPIMLILFSILAVIAYNIIR